MATAMVPAASASVAPVSRGVLWRAVMVRIRLWLGWRRLARQQRGRRWGQVAGQRLHEGDEIVTLLLRQAERLDLRRTAGPIDPTAIVVVHDRIQRRNGSVMHVGAAERDLTQSGRLERVDHLLYARHDLGAPEVGARKADIVEAVVGEIPSGVTVRAAGLGVEQNKAASCLLRNRGIIALDPGIERRTSGYDRALVGRDRLGDGFGSDTLSRENSLEKRTVSVDTLQLFEQLIDRQIHFDVSPYWAERLLLERAGTAVPHEDLAESRVDDGRRSAAELFHAVANACRLTIAPSIGRAMTGPAGQDVRCREPRVEKELLAERRFLDRIWIVLRERDRRRAAIVRLHLRQRSSSISFEIRACCRSAGRGRIAPDCTKRDQDNCTRGRGERDP